MAAKQTLALARIIAVRAVVSAQFLNLAQVEVAFQPMRVAVQMEVVQRPLTKVTVKHHFSLDVTIKQECYNQLDHLALMVVLRVQ